MAMLSRRPNRALWQNPSIIPAGLLSFLTGLSLSRLLYEAYFPSLQMFGGWSGTLVLALALGLMGSYFALRLADWLPRPWHALLPFLPLAINAPFLVEERVLLLESRWLFALSLLLAFSLLVWLLARLNEMTVWPVLSLLLLVGTLYLQTMGRTVGRADTFEFQVRTLDLGIVHPTGYPLWLLLAKPFTWLPLGTPAWRVNLAAAFWGLLATAMLFFLVRELTGKSYAAWVAAFVWAVRPTFWSQAIEAEVYTLHTVFVVGALWQMVWLARRSPKLATSAASWRFVWLTAWLGLGLTNHLTTLFLGPAAAYLLLRYWLSQNDKLGSLKWFVPRLLPALILPLTIYIYLPWRWQVTNGEPMGLSRFIDWVVGGRFQDALQWGAWLNDPARWQIVGRLFLDEWGLVGLLVALVSAVFLLWRRSQSGIVLLLTWIGFTFYCLNYLVPDLAVFLLPAQLVVAIALGAMPGLLAEIVGEVRLKRLRWGEPAGSLLILGLLAWFALAVPATWTRVDRSAEDNFTDWGRQVLGLPLAEGATILADSEKIAPLLYLQEAEGLRPDLNIMVLPDEAAYLNELNNRLANDESVYLARFLPRLEGIYHLRSVGPLTEVSKESLLALPAGVEPGGRQVGPLQLLGWRADLDLYNESRGLTLFWQTQGVIDENLLIYSRWLADGYASSPEPLNGQHPANNFYPTLAWDDGEIVADFQQLSWPRGVVADEIIFQVAVAPAYSAQDELEWVDVRAYPARYDDSAAAGNEDPLPTEIRPVRSLIGEAALTGISLPATARLNSQPTILAGCLANETLRFRWYDDMGAPVSQVVETTCGPANGVVRLDLPLPIENGSYQLWVLAQAEGQTRCGWLRRGAEGCALGEIELIGAPLPDGATNFADQIGLLSLNVPEMSLQPGGQLAVDVTWQSLLPLDKDYTVFVQILDENDQLVGQLDTWPLQGTFPTSQWLAGELVEDRYVVDVSPELTVGEYRLIIGWYLLGTPIQRLVVLDPAGAPSDDKVEVTGLVYSGGP